MTRSAALFRSMCDASSFMPLFQFLLGAVGACVCPYFMKYAAIPFMLLGFIIFLVLNSKAKRWGIWRADRYSFGDDVAGASLLFFTMVFWPLVLPVVLAAAPHFESERRRLEVQEVMET